MANSKDNLRVTMGVCGMDIALDNIILKQAIDDIGGFPFRRAYNRWIK